MNQIIQRSCYQPRPLLEATWPYRKAPPHQDLPLKSKVHPPLLLNERDNSYDIHHPKVTDVNCQKPIGLAQRPLPLHGHHYFSRSITPNCSMKEQFLQTRPSGGYVSTHVNFQKPLVHWPHRRSTTSFYDLDHPGYHTHPLQKNQLVLPKGPPTPRTTTNFCFQGPPLQIAQTETIPVTSIIQRSFTTRVSYQKPLKPLGLAQRPPKFPGPPSTTNFCFQGLP